MNFILPISMNSYRWEPTVPYVWSCYFLMLVVLLVLVFIPNILCATPKKIGALA